MDMSKNTTTNINQIPDLESGEILRAAKRMGCRKVPIREAKRICRNAWEIYEFEGRVLMSERIAGSLYFRYRAFDSVEDASRPGRLHRVVAQYDTTVGKGGPMVVRQWLNDIGAVK